MYEFENIEWDTVKAKKNIVKHGLDFNDAVKIFDDKKAKTFASPQKGETRYKTIGICNGQIIVVIHTPRDGNCRIISMRKSRPEERNQYAD
jgi:uncharacterized DUF497 family protein